jgi:hypothetical protein
VLLIKYCLRGKERCELIRWEGWNFTGHLHFQLQEAACGSVSSVACVERGAVCL